MRTKWKMGEQINANSLIVERCGCDAWRTIDTENGHVCYGDPTLGMSHESTLACVPPLPKDGSSDRAWQRWAARCRQMIHD